MQAAIMAGRLGGHRLELLESPSRAVRYLDALDEAEEVDLQPRGLHPRSGPQPVQACPAGKLLMQYRRNFTVRRTDNVSGGNRKYRASKRDCQPCELKPRCCPNTPVRDVLRSVHEEAREHARQMADTPEF